MDASNPSAARAARVMIVDDESHVRTYLRFLISSMNLTIVAEASNGVEALAGYRENRPDLVLLDLNMPVRTGHEALQDILQEDPAARVIMLSSMADRQSVERCAELGAANFIRKDCSPNDIRAIIRETLA